MSSDKQWYTLNTKPNGELQVKRLLQQRGFQIYLPLFREVKDKRGGSAQPLFPGYLFVKVNFEQVPLSAIQWTPGLRRVVAFGNQPIPLADEAIELIKFKLAQSNKDGTFHAGTTFRQGDIVRFATGPFRNMLAIFDRPVSASDRVQVLLEILGQTSRVRVPVSDLVRTNSNDGGSKPKRPRRSRGRGRRITH